MEAWLVGPDVPFSNSSGISSALRNAGEYRSKSGSGKLAATMSLSLDTLTALFA